ncbi:hypothetical protein FCR2A7T_00750 [Flavobacterium cauense R2A-7]|nr:hypothetical protein FCR2A7T_00750 [Flavobacterium cauense R2A-7]
MVSVLTGISRNPIKVSKLSAYMGKFFNDFEAFLVVIQS